MNNEKNKNMKQAIALKYNEKEMAAPQVVAKGKGLVADNIIDKAKENDLPIHEDKALVELLGQLDINESIPEELYQAVAEVFAYIYRLNEAARK